ATAVIANGTTAKAEEIEIAIGNVAGIATAIGTVSTTESDVEIGGATVGIESIGVIESEAEAEAAAASVIRVVEDLLDPTSALCSFWFGERALTFLENS